MSSKKKRLIALGIAFTLLVSAYPAFVLAYTLSHVTSAEFEGGRHGPLDAYRHALASAVVSYTLNKRVVDLVSFIMESRGEDSNLMDIHNNGIGADIGANARSFSEIEPTVHSYVVNGEVNTTSPGKLTWLPKEEWREGKAW